MEQLYQMTITAVAEVRDAEGNLKSSEPISITQTLTADQLAELTAQPEEKSWPEGSQPAQ